MDLRRADPREPNVRALLLAHIEDAWSSEASRRRAAEEIDAWPVHARLWGAWIDGDLAGLGGWTRLTNDRAELKWFHTAEGQRRKGAARAILEAIVEEARYAGIRELFLETGVRPHFDAARRFYVRHGFAQCAPFGSYGPNHHSFFMRREIAAPPALVSDAPAKLRRAEPTEPVVAELLTEHARSAWIEVSPESCHAFRPEDWPTDARLWTAWIGDELVATGGWSPIDAAHAELKAFHTRAHARGRGIAGLLLDTIEEEARADGLQRLSLETATLPYFDAARTFYAQRGFVQCGPFGAYGPDPFSFYMTKRIAQPDMSKINLDAALASFDETWSPRIAARVNDCLVKLAKLEGAFDWHSHTTEDELFLVISGRLRMELRDGDVTLEPGEFLVVPAGVERRPVAEPTCEVLLFEADTTRNTGDRITDRTVDPKPL